MTIIATEIRKIAEPHHDKVGGIITALREIQYQFSCIPKVADETVADVFNISKAEVRGIVSFYTDFTREPKSKIVIRICAAEACQAVGARRLRKDVTAMINERHNSSNKEVSVDVETVYCLGLCSAAPAAMVGSRLVGRADVKSIAAHISPGMRGE